MKIASFIPFPLSFIPASRITFPFKIYAFNPLLECYDLLIDANNGFIDDKKTFAYACLHKGGHLAIKNTQFITFVRDLGLPYSYENELTRAYFQNRENDIRFISRKFKRDKNLIDLENTPEKFINLLKAGSGLKERISHFKASLIDPKNPNNVVNFDIKSKYTDYINDELKKMGLTQDQIDVMNGKDNFESIEKTEKSKKVSNENNHNADIENFEDFNTIEVKNKDDDASKKKINKNLLEAVFGSKQNKEEKNQKLEQNLLNKDISEDDLNPIESAQKNNEFSEDNYEQNKTKVEEIANIMDECLSEDDFLKFIMLARKEILSMPNNVSYTLSLARELTKILLDHDSFHNRIIAFTYFLARFNGIKEFDEYGDLICASYLYDIGLTQMETHLSYTPINKQDMDEELLFKKHHGLSLHLIRKNGAKLSQRCLKIIEDHHERASGGGFPLGKTEYTMENLSQYLGLVDHVFWYASGLINGNDYRVERVVDMIKNRTPSPKLDLDFNDNLIAAFSQLIRSDFINEEEEEEEENNDVDRNELKVA